MRKFPLLLIAVAAIVFVSCKKDAKCPYSDISIVAPQSEIDSVSRYLTANSLTAVRHPSGLFYTIGSAAGAGATPEVCSNLTVQYEGFLFSGNRFDGTTGTNVASFTLGQTIEGWKKGIPVIKAGGSVTLYIPPTLGYGSEPRYNNLGQIVIPANSYLKFTVNLVAVQ